MENDKGSYVNRIDRLVEENETMTELKTTISNNHTSRGKLHLVRIIWTIASDTNIPLKINSIELIGQEENADEPFSSLEYV